MLATSLHWLITDIESKKQLTTSPANRKPKPTARACPLPFQQQSARQFFP